LERSCHWMLFFTHPRRQAWGACSAKTAWSQPCRELSLCRRKVLSPLFSWCGRCRSIGPLCATFHRTVPSRRDDSGQSAVLREEPHRGYRRRFRSGLSFSARHRTLLSRGWCADGVLAHEMARQLEARGSTIGLHCALRQPQSGVSKGLPQRQTALHRLGHLIWDTKYHFACLRQLGKKGNPRLYRRTGQGSWSDRPQAFVRSQGQIGTGSRGR